MLYLFYGNNTPMVREKAYDYVRAQEKEGVRTETISAENFVPGSFSDLAGAVSLFGGTHIVVIDAPAEKESLFVEVLDQCALFQESPHTFVLICGPLTAGAKKRITAHAEAANESSERTSQPFTIFSLTDALGRRDKKTLWMLYSEAVQKQVTSEEIIGALFWQIKTLRLVAQTTSATEAGVKPFVYTKAKQALKRYRVSELHAYSRELIRIYHDGHLGKTDSVVALERWILSL